MMRAIALIAIFAAALRAEPQADPNAVMLPTFIFDQRHAITAGVAFPIEEAGQRYLVTAHHVLGPPGGLPSKMAAADVPRQVKAVAALCLGDQKTVILAQPALLVADARPFDADGGDADVAFVRISDVRSVPALRLAKATPEKGARVWMFARMVDRDRPQLYAATVLQAGPTLLQYQFEDSRLNLRALSGAPVLGASGEVVALHLGYGVRDDKLIGLGAPSPALRRRLSIATQPGGP